MARARDPGDIIVGSIWTGRTGGSARVLSVSAGYVRFVDASGEPDTRHQWEFRRRYMSPREARQAAREQHLPRDVIGRCRSQFSMSIANLVACHIFFSRTCSRIFARSSGVPLEECHKPARGRPALPPDAIHIGTYAEPASPDAFFEDLNDALASQGNSGSPAN
jgi:hypothetical protein